MLLAQGGSTAATLARPVAYAFAIWGGALFLWSGALYLVQTRAALRSSVRSSARPAPL
jgi:cardiolipin synthase